MLISVCFFSFTAQSDPSSICHRSFAHINSSVSTRRAFIALFKRSFLQTADGRPSNGNHVLNTSAVSAESVHQLCCFLCADFPFSLVRNAARITNDTTDGGGNISSDTTVSNGSGSSPSADVSLSSFSHKLFVLFLFSEFLNQCALAFRALDVNGTGRVNRKRFARRLQSIVDNAEVGQGCPSAKAIEQTLKSTTLANSSNAPTNATSSASTDSAKTEDDQIMFNAFCVTLFAHPLVAQALISP
jgi:hypothetical protein